jgi:hypothetical protein
VQSFSGEGSLAIGPTDGKLRGIVRTAAESYTEDDTVVVQTPSSPARGLSYADALKAKSQSQRLEPAAPVTVTVAPAEAATKPALTPSTSQRTHADANLKKLMMSVLLSVYVAGCVCGICSHWLLLRRVIEGLTDDTVGSAVALLPQNPMTSAHQRPQSNKTSQHTIVLNAKNTSDLLHALVNRARSHADATCVPPGPSLLSASNLFLRNFAVCRRCCATLLCHIGLRYVVLPSDILGPDGAPLTSVEIPTFRTLLFKALHASPASNNTFEEATAQARTSRGIAVASHGYCFIRAFPTPATDGGELA